MNYRFNIAEWLPRFPLTPEYGHFSGEIITSPCHVCNNEQLRQAARDQFDWGPAVPVDIFVMADGEPPDRHVTKIGGLPYRPAGAPWPVGPDGEPLLFLAQFDFADSIDIVGNLPGDVLLVFMAASDGLIDSLHFEWQTLGIEALASAGEVPEPKTRLNPCYGHVFRTLSYPQACRKAEIVESKYPTCYGRGVSDEFLLFQYQATQIGRAPFYIQPGAENLPGRVLCAISSVQPDSHKPFPWVNRPEPLMSEGQWRPHDNHLMIGDVGCIYISIDDRGRLHYNESSF